MENSLILRLIAMIMWTTGTIFAYGNIREDKDAYLWIGLACIGLITYMSVIRADIIWEIRNKQ